jgi:hypothetical protein
MLGDSVEYTKEALIDKYMRWLILIIGSIIFPIILGYTLRIYRGDATPPGTDDLVELFIDGVKLFVVELIWALPVIVVAVIVFGGSVALMMSGSNVAAAAGVGGIFLGIFLVLVVGIMVSLFAAMGAVRFARTDSFGEAFDFSAIIAHIGRIGWGSYVIALVVLGVVLAVINMVLSIIPILGWLISIVLAPAFAIFAARYITLLYDSAPAPA